MLRNVVLEIKLTNCNNRVSYILIYIQQDAKLHSLFYLEAVLHVSGGTITHHQERKQLYLQHLVFVTPLLLPATIAVPPETCRAASRQNKLCNLHLVGYIFEYSYDARNHER